VVGFDSKVFSTKIQGDFEMPRKLTRVISVLFVFAFILGMTVTSVYGQDAPIKVGLSFSDFATERWRNEEILMRGLLEGLGYEVISQEANQDVVLQNNQIDTMVAQGVKAIIVVAEDGDAVSTAVDAAAANGVAVLAYDLIV
jgi:D-xylose transport system substrate-binding protein